MLRIADWGFVYTSHGKKKFISFKQYMVQEDFNFSDLNIGPVSEYMRFYAFLDKDSGKISYFSKKRPSPESKEIFNLFKKGIWDDGQFYEIKFLSNLVKSNKERDVDFYNDENSYRLNIGRKTTKDFEIKKLTEKDKKSVISYFKNNEESDFDKFATR
ncbi:hypothetical protein [Peptoniphilus harei]|uniref:Uncharacterized protein n=1 Tax=Peptoniphilus harei TaxID=54005 RepID=A0A943XVF4_9FIRM|nr:hypothetical protein [Peptoniphilus harei]MBS6535380.1 hypothetical protein [Peptoniphilus harei]